MVRIKLEIPINIRGRHKLALSKSTISYYIYEKKREGDFYKEAGITLKYD